MQVLKPYPAKADFRHDKLVVELLRICINSITASMPELAEEDYQDLLLQYRNAIGERTVHDRVSNAKVMLDQHLSGFRHLYSNVLGTCLMSQLDKLQGREAAWPTMDTEAPGLVSDAVIERRMAIDEVSRLIPVDADEGVTVFDILLCHALGRKPTTLRDNPLRPAVFYHAIGVCWVRAASSNNAELFIIRKFGSLLAQAIAKAYPAMTAVLRAGLDAPKPPSAASLLMRRDAASGSPYARLSSTQVVEASPTPQSVITPKPQPAAQAALQWLNQQLEPVLCANSVSPRLRLAISSLQLPLLKLVLNDTGQLDRAPGALHRLVQDLGNLNAWRRLSVKEEAVAAVEMHLAVIQELLKREQSDPNKSALMIDHLRKQLLTLLREPESEAA